jgi:hypothetical protein
MSLLHDGILEKKYDVRVIEKNLTRGVVSDQEVKKFVEQLPDDSENAVYINLDEIETQ